MKTTRNIFLFFAIASIFISAWPVAKADKPVADKPVDGEVLVILAKEAEGDIDPKLKNISALSKPPFNAFKSMKVLSTSSVKFTKGKSVETALPNKGKLKVALQDTLKDGRFKVEVSISKAEKKDFLPLLQVKASAGKHFFVAGQKHQGGTLIIGIQVGGTQKK